MFPTQMQAKIYNPIVFSLHVPESFCLMTDNKTFIAGYKKKINRDKNMRCASCKQSFTLLS